MSEKKTAPSSLPPPPRSAPPPKSTQVDRPKFGVRKTSNLGHAVVLNAVEGWGKTCMGAHLPGAAIMVIGEDLGYETLQEAGLVPEIPSMRISTWKSLLDAIDEIYHNPPEGVKVVVFDTLTGMESLCHKWICDVRFKGNWGTEDGKGFNAFKQGPAIAAPEFLRMLSKLDNIRTKHGIHFLVLSHAASITFRDPMGPNYDRYVGGVHDRTWSACKQWADAVLFGNYEAQVEVMRPQDEGQAHAHGKGTGVGLRVMFTDRADSYDAKNRFGLPARIDVNYDHTESWKVLNRIFKLSK